MRPTFDPQDNINGIISNGGSAANVIPASADCEFCIRADTMKRIEGLIDVIKLCVRNAEQLTGAKADISWGEISAERYPNRPMCQAFKDNMEILGIKMKWPDPKAQYGSSDIGNVSIKFRRFMIICRSLMIKRFKVTQKLMQTQPPHRKPTKSA